MKPNDPFQSNHGVGVGTRLNGIYEIDHMIGAGGMGEVYKGHEIQTGTAVAIKMLLPDMASNEAALALFRREASALHYLMHDAIVRYFVFTVEPVLQRPYLAMEYVDGRSLADVVNEEPLTLEALLCLTKRVASGLKAAHERGIIHRDVSPDNIIIPRSDVARAKIIDFGIARSTQLADATIIGSGFAGKHNYVSPEQIGLYSGDVTAQSDVYSLGLVLFFALTGQKLDMGGTQFQLVEKRRRLPDLGAIDARIRPLFEQMLQPDPKDRPTMAQIENWDIGTAPKIIWPGQLEHPSKPAAPSQLTPKPKRGWVRYAALAAVGLLVVGSCSAAYYYFIWNATIAVAPPPIPALKQGQTASRPPDGGLTSKETSKDIGVKPPDSPAQSDLARRFLQQYDGGDCFFIMPVAVGSSAAVVEGFGASTTAFEALDRSFKKSQGFEASIGIRLVTPPQCPAITFLNKVRGDVARAPRISLGSVKIRPNETLTGNVENFANRVVELLLVSEDGQVQNLSYYLRPGTDALSFSIEMKRSESGLGSNVPQLIMAVATPRVLDSLRQPRPTPADQFFLQVLSEAQRTNLNINASARYVTIQK
ncbi:serine/threonine-protein kinase [Bradyrhizobium sp. AUGA SZCCT0182]|uniref:serine/threonine-protein kinase n=1 Tax=Bradyrhizobium sp. AUGA SZCCT0182 TaxID=2807667 RepID=UPI001BA5F1E3|nr:serine/threonine-protein kinase [Bradyrhizobium sp. AUGA SZCCT0182]MBR1232058.1 serine/threonine protein kinase [Bradyrhizobium sp. AUGA SZCCT0182]